MILGYSMLDLQYFLIKIRDFIMPLYQGKTLVKEWFLLSVTIILRCKCIISWMLRPDLIDEATRYSLQILSSVFYCPAFVLEFDENATAWISAPIRSPVSTVTGAIAMRQKVENLHFSWVCWPLGADQGITAPRHETDLGGAKLLMGQPWSWAETKTRDMS